jgi:hypothetical protein
MKYQLKKKKIAEKLDHMKKQEEFIKKARV